MLPARPILATYAQGVTRAVLLALGLDHALIDFLAHTAVGAAILVFTIFLVANRVPRRSGLRIGSSPASAPLSVCNFVHVDNRAVRGQNNSRSSSEKGFETGRNESREKNKMSRIRISCAQAAVIPLVMMLLTLSASLAAQTAIAPPVAPDSTLFTTYSLFSGEQTLDWIVCGSTAGSSGCYASGSLGPFGKIGAMIEGNPTISGSTVTRMIYVVDIAAGTGGTGVTLYSYKKTDTVSSTSDTVTVTLSKTVSLPLAGGASAVCSMAATPTLLFIGTNQSVQAVTVKKSTLTATQVGTYILGINVTGITVDKYGYVTVTQGGFTSGSNGFSVFNSTGVAQEDGGGADFMLDTTAAVSTANLPTASSHLSERLGVTPKTATAPGQP
jgi:hypothetical protein